MPSDAPPQAADWQRIAAWIALSWIVLLGGVLRAWGLNHSLWLDELHTSWVVSAGLSELPTRAAQGNYSPLYPFLAWCSQALVGQTEVALRLPSVAAGTALIAVAYALLTAAARSRAAGLWAALLVSLDASCVYFSQEARAAACVQLAVALNYAVFALLVIQPGNSRWRRALWALTAVAAFYLHYTAALALAGQPLWLVLHWLVERLTSAPSRLAVEDRGWGAARYGWRDYLVDAALAALCCLPAVPHLREIYAHRDEWRQFLRPVPLEQALTTFPLLHYLAAPLLSLLAHWVVIRVPAQSGTMDAAAGHDYGAPRGARRALGTLITLWYLAAVLLAWLLGLVHLRYCIGAAAALPVLAGLVIGTRRFATVQILVAAAVLLPLQLRDGLVQEYRRSGTFAGHATEDWRAAVGWIRQEDPGASWPVFLQARLIESRRLYDPRLAQDQRLRRYLLYPLTGRIYSLREYELAPLPGNAQREPIELDTAQLERVLTCGGAWIVIRADAVPATATARVVADLRRRGAKVEVRRRAFQGVVVLRLAATN